MLPPAAMADCGGKPSAVNVYTECVPSGGGGKPTSSSHTSGGSTSVPVSHQTQEELNQAGADGKSLSNLVNTYGLSRHLQSVSSDSETEPTAVGSAFDLGSGPTALLIVLAGTAILLLGATGFRTVRQRRR